MRPDPDPPTLFWMNTVLTGSQLPQVADVMTRDVGKVQQPNRPASDPARFDLPDEPYQLTIKGPHGATAKAGMLDPVTGASLPVKIARRAARNP